MLQWAASWPIGFPRPNRADSCARRSTKKCKCLAGRVSGCGASPRHFKWNSMVEGFSLCSHGVVLGHLMTTKLICIYLCRYVYIYIYTYTHYILQTTITYYINIYTYYNTCMLISIYILYIHRCIYIYMYDYGDQKQSGEMLHGAYLRL